MKLLIPYSEAIQLAKEKSGKDITLAAVSDKTIKVGLVLKFKIPFINSYASKNVYIDVTYEKLEGEDIHLSYDGGKAIDMLLEGAKLLASEINITELMEFVDFHSGNKVVVHLGKIEQAHEALQKIQINDIKFKENDTEVDFSLKL